jgi:hypothetical protein
MFVRRLIAIVLGCTLAAALAASIAAYRGPSTVEERAQMLERIHARQSDPLGPHAKDELSTVLKFFADVPDLPVHVCMLLDLPKGDRKGSSSIFAGEFMGQAAFVIQSFDKRDNRLEEYEAGVEGALQIDELVLKSNAKDRQPALDELLKKRADGTVREYVKARAEACDK